MAESFQSITGRQTTAGAGVETVSLTVDGATPATTVAIAAGSVFSISDAIYGGILTGNQVWQIQQANDGSTFFDIARVVGIFNTGALSTPSAHTKFEPGLVIDGNAGADVRIRLRVTTVAGATAVIFTLRSSLVS